MKTVLEKDMTAEKTQKRENTQRILEMPSENIIL